MRLHAVPLAALMLCSLPLASAQSSAQVAIHGERLAGSDLGPHVVETMADVLAREKATMSASTPSAMPPPSRPGHLRSLAPPSEPGSRALGGLGTAPALGTNFQGPWINDVGAGFIPPDPHGAIGPSHFLAIVNQHVSVYDRSGTRLLATSLQSFFGVASTIGDVRAAYDHFSGRFVITGSGFNGTRRIYLAVSSSGDPTASWFKTFFVAGSGGDAGSWPDYPTLGFDANGIYSAASMVGPADTMTIFAIDKAPLVAATQTLGTITAFRGLLREGAIQGAVTFGAPAGEYMISREGPTTLRVRRVDPPLTAPTLVELGLVTVPFMFDPPYMTVQGSNPFWTIDSRPLGAVFQNGSLWTLHGTDVGGRAAVRWYQIDPLTLATQQVGTIDDPTRHFGFPSMAVDASGNVAFGFAGSKSSEFAGAWYAGRKSTDPAGQTSPPALLRAGFAPYQLQDGSGFNRWGDYTNTTLDPLDGTSFWTIQEYAQATNDWGTWIGKLSFPGDNAPISFCAGDGSLPTACACVPPNTIPLPPAAAGHGCANSQNLNGALLSATGATSPDTITLNVFVSPVYVGFGLLLKGDATAPGGIASADGVRCVDGRLIRFGSHNAATYGASQGYWTYPNTMQTTPVSVQTMQPAGQTAYYQMYYRNTFAGFCTAATTNWSNGIQIAWP